MDQPKRKTAALIRFAAVLEPRFPLRLLGFGLIYVWSSCVWETSIFFSGRISSDAGGMFDIWLLSACLTPIALITCALAGRKRELTEYPILFLIGPLLAVVGTVCIALYSHSPADLQMPLILFAGIGTGVGPAIMIILWVALYASLDIDVVETVVPSSFLLIVICMFIIPCLTAPIAVPLATVLPIASGILLVLSLKSAPSPPVAQKSGSVAASESPATGGNSSGAPDEGGTGITPVTYSRTSMLRTFVLILVTYAISCSVSFLQQDTVPLLPDSTAVIIGMLFAVALSMAIVLFSAHIDLEVYFRWMSAPLILSVVFAAFPNGIASTLSAILANAMFTSLEIIMILYFIRLAQKTVRPASFFIGIGSCATYTGVLIGYLLGMQGGHLAAIGTLDIASCCLALTGIFAVAMLLVPRKDSTWTGSRPDSTVLDHAEAISKPRASFEVRCDTIAEKYRLSTRETEVFKLLAQGRSQPYIRDLLYLSKNTVSTHIKHIYRKLDIHSKEELIDLIADK